ncbi:DUF58 domain-containing protein [Persephonella sp.]
MGISGFLGRRNLSGLDLEVDLPEEIFAGTEFPVRVRLKNRKKFFPSFLISFSFEGKKHVVPYIDPRGVYEFHMMYRYDTRGRKDIDHFDICSVFPFNFFVRCIVYHKKIPVVVYPRPMNCPFPPDFSKKGKAGGSFSTDRTGFYDEMVSIRDYSPGDPLKYIHWKASAKTGVLKTKELTDSSNRPVVIDLDRIKGNREEKISCATHLILELYRMGVPFGLKYGKKFIKPEFSRRQKALILTELALL